MPRPLSAVVSLAAGSPATGPLTASPAQAATGAMTSLAGKPLDAAGASSADGTAVQLYDGDDTAAQQRTVGSDGPVRALGRSVNRDRPCTGAAPPTTAPV
ncbi:hypothetical protein [Streptomyces sp. NBC_00878]|uniref:hypothetical protein n=1 Tax=Streptomyces sp. NBC_00878 TaxID=2975854 RepID=UPI00224D34FD|nr:hypothetical protein [Streptomyces sp. NBC_00878]MCX4911180.1 hypothetical protein [Streptomyces sp. NBC_00878]